MKPTTKQIEREARRVDWIISDPQDTWSESCKRLAAHIIRRIAAAERRGRKQGWDEALAAAKGAVRKASERRRVPIVTDEPCCGFCNYDEAEGFLLKRCPKCAAKMKAKKGTKQ